MKRRSEVEKRKVRLEVRESPIHGLGVFAAGAISAGATTATVTGEPKHYSLFPQDLLLMRGFEVAEDTYIVPDRESPAWSFNHSNAPNCRYSVETRTVTALRDISPGEELTIDYRDTTTWGGYEALWKQDVPP